MDTLQNAERNSKSGIDAFVASFWAFDLQDTWFTAKDLAH